MRCSDCTFAINHISGTARSNALEVMEGNFRKTINPNGNDRGSDSNRRVTHHVAVFPRPGAHIPWQNRIQTDRDRPGQTDLASVGVAAQKQIETGMCSLTIDFRCVRQEDREPVFRNFGCRLFDVVDPVIVSIVDAG